MSDYLSIKKKSNNSMTATVSMSYDYFKAMERLYPGWSRSKAMQAIMESSKVFMKKVKEVRAESEKTV